MDELRAEVSNMRADLWDDVKAGRIRVPIDKTYPLEQAPQAMQALLERSVTGRVAIAMS